MQTQVASGTFEIVMTPVQGAPEGIGSLLLQKAYSGDLAGSSAGQMLAVRTPQEGSAGYVAMERITGTLAGRAGGFSLQHSGTMERGDAVARVTVIPDSGTEGLAGLTGSMVITIEAKQHHYTLTYTLPA